MRKVLIGLATLMGLALAADGAALFGQHCAACHGVQGQGIPGFTPPLLDNPKVQDEAHVLGVIRAGFTGTAATMPPMPHVDEATAQAIAAYLLVMARGEPPPAVEPEPTPAVPADPALAARGRALFIGQQRFEQGGAPCMACHTAGNIGLLDGGNLGTDLTRLHARLGEAGVRGVLSNVAAFPVMRESYRGKLLTPEEIDALTAFFAQTAAGPPANPNRVDTARMLFPGLIGLVVLFGVMYLVWINRRQGLAERIRRRNT
jgi:mono/diheme cytochrome c family protein